jgi:hypothetical protein
MARQAEGPKARIKPALLFSDEISPQDAAKTEAGKWEAASEQVNEQRSGCAGHCGVVLVRQQQNARNGGPVPPSNA